MFMLSMKNIMVIIVIHIIPIGISICVFRPSSVSVEPVRMPRVRFIICVRGSVINAMPCAVWGSEESGKNVPLKNSIGVISRNMG